MGEEKGDEKYSSSPGIEMMDLAPFADNEAMEGIGGSIAGQSQYSPIGLCVPSEELTRGEKDLDCESMAATTSTEGNDSSLDLTISYSLEGDSDDSLLGGVASLAPEKVGGLIKDRSRVERGGPCIGEGEERYVCLTSSSEMRLVSQVTASQPEGQGCKRVRFADSVSFAHTTVPAEIFSPLPLGRKTVADMDLCDAEDQAELKRRPLEVIERQTNPPKIVSDQELYPVKPSGGSYNNGEDSIQSMSDTESSLDEGSSIGQAMERASVAISNVYLDIQKQSIGSSSLVGDSSHRYIKREAMTRGSKESINDTENYVEGTKMDKDEKGDRIRVRYPPVISVTEQSHIESSLTFEDKQQEDADFEMKIEDKEADTKALSQTHAYSVPIINDEERRELFQLNNVFHPTEAADEALIARNSEKVRAEYTLSFKEENKRESLQRANSWPPDGARPLSAVGDLKSWDIHDDTKSALNWSVMSTELSEGKHQGRQESTKSAEQRVEDFFASLDQIHDFDVDITQNDSALSEESIDAYHVACGQGLEDTLKFRNMMLAEHINMVNSRDGSTDFEIATKSETRQEIICAEDQLQEHRVSHDSFATSLQDTRVRIEETTQIRMKRLRGKIEKARSSMEQDLEQSVKKQATKVEKIETQLDLMEESQKPTCIGVILEMSVKDKSIETLGHNLCEATHQRDILNEQLKTHTVLLQTVRKDTRTVQQIILNSKEQIRQINSDHINAIREEEEILYAFGKQMKHEVSSKLQKELKQSENYYKVLEEECMSTQKKNSALEDAIKATNFESQSSKISWQEQKEKLAAEVAKLKTG